MAGKEIKKDLASVLSAYLDGELTPAQTRKVERQLAEDESARKLLKELQEVAQMVQMLPQERAPEDLAGPVMEQLERDMLLERGGVLAELAGQKHLRLRHFIAAAALIMLTGAMGVIIYSALNEPEKAAHQVPESIIALAPDTATDPEKTTAGTEKSGDLVMAGPKAGELETPEPVIPDFQYSNISILVHSSEAPAEQRRLEQIFIEQEIKDVIRTELGLQSRQYAFLCQREQFRKLFQQFQQQPGNSLDLIISDPGGGREIMLLSPDEEQAMALAGEPNATLQLADALRLTPAENIVALGSQKDQTARLLEWFASGEPELFELRALGPRQKESFTANEPARITGLGEGIPIDSASPDQDITDWDKTRYERTTPAETVAVVLVLQPLQPEIPTPPTGNGHN